MDNREAVAKIWKNDQEALKDALKEVEELLSPSDEDALDNGWDELDQELGDLTSELTEDEVILVKKVTLSMSLPFYRFLTRCPGSDSSRINVSLKKTTA
jgi:hypothetical protein